MTFRHDHILQVTLNQDGKLHRSTTQVINIQEKVEENYPIHLQSTLDMKIDCLTNLVLYLNSKVIKQSFVN